MLSIEHLALVVSHMADALERNGYSRTRIPIRLLTQRIQRDFGVKRIAELDEEGFADLMMYLDLWEPTSSMRFFLRKYKNISEFTTR